MPNYSEVETICNTKKILTDLRKLLPPDTYYHVYVCLMNAKEAKPPRGKSIQVSNPNLRNQARKRPRGEPRRKGVQDSSPNLQIQPRKRPRGKPRSESVQDSGPNLQTQANHWTSAQTPADYSLKNKTISRGLGKNIKTGMAFFSRRPSVVRVGLHKKNCEIF